MVGIDSPAVWSEVADLTAREITGALGSRS
jgi:hypothetical protein